MKNHEINFQQIPPSFVKYEHAYKISEMKIKRKREIDGNF